MGDDFILAHRQVVSNNSGEPLPDTEPKGDPTAAVSDANFSPVLEEFPGSDERRHEYEVDIDDANVSGSDWESIDEDTSQEVVDDENTFDKATKDHGASEEATEDENASDSKHPEPTWDNPDDLLSYVWSNVDPDSVFSVRIIRDMGKMCQKDGKFEMAESLLRMAQHKLDRIAGRLHEDTLDTVFSLATVLSHRGKLEEAGKLARRAIRGYLKVHGPRNAVTMRVLREISSAYTAICRQLLQHGPPAGSEERHQVSRHTNMYISICQELPLSAVPVMLGGLGLVLAMAGHTANANLAFQLKYASTIFKPRHLHVCKMCEQEILMLPLHVCLTCTDVELCSFCYWSFASSAQGGSEDSSVLASLSGCIAHEFFKVEHDDAQQLSGGDDLEITYQFNTWLGDAAKEVQGTNAGSSSPDPFLIGGEETPAEALSTYLMQRVTTETTQAFMTIQVTRGYEPLAVDNSETAKPLQTWFQDAINSIPSLEPCFRAKSEVTETIPASVMRHIMAKTIQKEDLWNSFEKPRKYNPNYPSNQEEVPPSIAGLAAKLMAEARSVKETITNQSNSRTTCVIPSESIYETLPLNESGTLIRLLEMLPGSTAEPLVCNLAVTDMLKSPVYEAVSYTWGIYASPSHGTEVQVNGVTLQVTPNLHACLLALRHRDASRILWVDAICINQKDDQEKSQQVARMTSIYSSASNVLVYLGDGGEAEEALFRYFNRERKDKESFEASLDRLGLMKLDILKTFAALCRRDWWTRIWIQQEFSLPPTSPTFCLGHLRARASPLILDVFETLYDEAMEMALSFSGDGLTPVSKPSEHIVQAAETLGMRVFFNLGPDNLNALLSRTPKSKSSDPRDIIFGRYIFMKPLLRTVFKPDYSLPTESLFEMVAMWLLKIEIGMELFCFYPHRLSSKSPSWVPDFTKRAEGIVSVFYTENIREWRAEKQTDDPLDIDHGHLSVHGRPLDTISHVFRVGDAPLPELVLQILSLEHSLFVIAEQDTPQRRHPLLAVLRGLRAKFLQEMDESIYAWVPHDAYVTLHEVASFVQSQFLDSFKRFLPIYYRLRIKKQARGFAVACLDFARDFANFHVLLKKQHFTKFFWASLCDSKNLIAQIKDLRTPTPQSSPLSKRRTGTMSLMNQMIKEIQVSDAPSPVIVENEDTLRVPSSSSPSYEDLQAAIADCEFEEGVYLRARFVVHLAKLIKSSVDADGKWIGPRDQLHEQVMDGQEKPVPELEGATEKTSYELLRQGAREFPHSTIFITEQRLVGVGRAGVTDIRVGDQLIMFENGVFPMVIRPRDLGFHEIVGYADIHGLDGEAFHRLCEGQKPPKRVFKFK